MGNFVEIQQFAGILSPYMNAVLSSVRTVSLHGDGLSLHFSPYLPCIFFLRVLSGSHCLRFNPPRRVLYRITFLPSSKQSTWDTRDGKWKIKSVLSGQIILVFQDFPISLKKKTLFSTCLLSLNTTASFRGWCRWHECLCGSDGPEPGRSRYAK